MSEDMYRNKLIRLQKKKAELEKEKSREAKKLEKLNSEIAKAQKDILKTKNDSTRRSKARQVESKTKNAVKVQEKLAKIESDLAKNLSDQSSAQKQHDRAAHYEYQPPSEEEETRPCYFCLDGWVFIGSIDHDGEEVTEFIRYRKCGGSGRIKNI